MHRFSLHPSPRPLPSFNPMNPVSCCNPLLDSEMGTWNIFSLQGISAEVHRCRHSWYLSLLIRHRIILACNEYTGKCINLQQKKQYGSKKNKILGPLSLKVLRLEKSTPPVVVTNISYGCRADVLHFSWTHFRDFKSIFQICWHQNVGSADLHIV